MTGPAFNRDFDVDYGVAEEVAPGIRRIVARNPGPFTFLGTGTYMIGRGEVAVVDPGPDDDAHVEALLRALAGETVTHILVTHTHRDHSPASRVLADATGARTFGFGPHPADDIGPGAITAGEEGGGAGKGTPEESHDLDFVPDVAVGDGDVIEGRGWQAEGVHTPGHISNHLCFAVRGTASASAFFSGDHVMGWSTSVVSPPAGDMAAYLDSLEKLLGREDGTYWPTHGPAIADPAPYVRSLIAHRRARERAVLARLAAGDSHIPEIVAACYPSLDERLVKAAGRSVLAHLVQLVAEGRVVSDGPVGAAAGFALAR